MRKIPILVLLMALAAALLPACHDDDDTLYDAYKDWREKNEQWIKEQMLRTNADGTPYFTTVIPNWDPSAYVLIHYLSDRQATEGNLSPMYTSTIDTRYYLTYYNGTPIDSSYTCTQWGPGVFRCELDGLIDGWVIAMEDMRVGDSAEIVIPYQQGYGVSTSTNVPPYTNLKFNVRLVDIVDYEKNPK